MPSLTIGGLLFESVDQADFTGPFEVLSRLPGAQFLSVARTLVPIQDARGLVLTPTTTWADAPPLDILLVPGGTGVNGLMEDAEFLAFLREKAATARIILSVCTGALLLGAAGLLRGRRATTHWASHHLLAAFGAIPDKARVVVDGNLVCAAGVTSGLDAALRVAALVAGDEVAQGIQLYLEYAPEPPLQSGSPESAPPEVLRAITEQLHATTSARNEIVRRITST